VRKIVKKTVRKKAVKRAAKRIVKKTVMKKAVKRAAKIMKSELNRNPQTRNSLLL
jgi:hypothetical protein